MTRLVLSAVLLLTAVESSSAREWRGIVPLRSTRADVVHLLNQCADQKEACRFSIESEDVHILFSSGVTSEPGGKCAPYLPPETVMFIEVQPRGKLKFSELRLDERRLQHFNPSDPARSGYKGYRSDDGLVVSLFKNEVLRIVYLAAEADKPRCPDFYERPTAFVEIVFPHYATVNLRGPESVKAGAMLKVSAYSNTNQTRGFTWAVTAGKITAGQYTKEITIDTSGLAGQQVVVSAETIDVGHHTATSSIVVKVLPD